MNIPELLKPVFLRRTLALALAALLAGASIPPCFAGAVDIGSLDNLNILRKVYNLIKSDYVKKELNDQELLTGAINGMLESLNDPYSRYLEPQNFKDMQSDTSGEFEGVGIVITVKNRIITVISPIDNTPALRAGIKAGDRILKIDGTDTDKMNLHDAVTKMRGKKDAPVVLTIWRDEFKEPRNFTIKRDVIPLVTVTAKLVADRIGYVRLSQFTETTAGDLEKEMTRLEGLGIEGLILDLRDNPGGLLTSAIDVSRKFLEKGTIVTVKSRDGKTLNLSSYYRSHPPIPLVVLINKGSASSSEIVAGAIQDCRRGILLGTKSFGKGVIQTVIPMDNDAGLILTTAWYFTPSGRSIHHKGIDPDISVEQPMLTDEESAELFSSFPQNAGKPGDADAGRKKYDVKPFDRQLITAIELLGGERPVGLSIYDNSVIKKVIAARNLNDARQGGAPSEKDER